MFPCNVRGGKGDCPEPISVKTLVLIVKIYKKQLEEHRAKVNATIRKETSKKLKTTKQMGQLSPFKCDNTQVFSGRMSSREYKIAPQKYSVVNLEPLDMGAHLQLLGESLMLVGSALRRQVCSICCL